MVRVSRRGRLARACGSAAASLIAGLALVPGSLAAAQRPFQATCRSGRTLFHHGGIRAFSVSFFDVADHGEHHEALACLGRSRKPLVIYDPGPFNFVQAGRFRIVGHRLGFVIHDQGFANGSETDVGSVDLPTRGVRLGLLNAGENAGPNDPLLPEDAIAYAFAPDGATAVIAGTACQIVAVLPVAGIHRLGPPVVLFTAAHGGLVARSIAINPTAVTWRTATGSPGSAPRSAPATRSPTGGC